MNILEKLKGPLLDAAFMALAEREKDSSIGYLQLKDLLTYQGYMGQETYSKIENMLESLIHKPLPNFKERLESYIEDMLSNNEKCIFYLDSNPFLPEKTQEEIEFAIIEHGVLKKRYEVFCPKKSEVIYCGYDLPKKIYCDLCDKKHKDYIVWTSYGKPDNTTKLPANHLANSMPKNDD